MKEFISRNVHQMKGESTFYKCKYLLAITLGCIAFSLAKVAEAIEHDAIEWGLEQRIW